MMRRSAFLTRGFLHIRDPHEPIEEYSTFNWDVAMSQVMPSGQRQNRTMAAPNRQFRTNAFKSVWIDTELHPAFRVALDPYLRKLPLSRAVPRTAPDEAVRDFDSVAPLVDHDASRWGWLAKVAQLCAIHKKADLLLPQWQKHGCHDRFVTGTEVPPTPLAKAVVFATAASAVPEFKGFFECSLKHKWNSTPSFCEQLWARCLRAAGQLADEKLVTAVLEEMLDLQVNLDVIDRPAYVIAFNAVKSTEEYEKVKKFLFKVSPHACDHIVKSYVYLRSQAELKKEGAYELPENDNMFYHVQWHARIRNPLKFDPRRLFFDYKPSNMDSVLGSVDERRKMGGKDIIDAKLEKWKADGLLPEDYEHEEKFYDYQAAHQSSQRQEGWKRKPKEITDLGVGIKY